MPIAQGSRAGGQGTESLAAVYPGPLGPTGVALPREGRSKCRRDARPGRPPRGFRRRLRSYLCLRTVSEYVFAA